MLILRDLTDNELRIVHEDRRAAAGAVIGTEAFPAAMERVRDCGAEWDRRNQAIKVQIDELEAIGRTTAASIEALRTAKGDV